MSRPKLNSDPPTPPPPRPKSYEVVGKKYDIYMSGYLRKLTAGELHKSQHDEKKYVEVENGKLTWYKSRVERKERNPEKFIDLTLPGTCVSVEEGNIIRLESKDEVRLFTASSEALANKWLLIISRFCPIPSLPEGFCEKLSGGKKIFEERYLKLTGDGILSWYRNTDPRSLRGAIEIRGVADVGVIDGNKRIVFVETQEPRIYQLRFIDADEAQFWHTAFQHYAKKEKLKYTLVHTRNSCNKQ